MIEERDIRSEVKSQTYQRGATDLPVPGCKESALGNRFG